MAFSVESDDKTKMVEADLSSCKASFSFIVGAGPISFFIINGYPLSPGSRPILTLKISLIHCRPIITDNDQVRNLSRSLLVERLGGLAVSGELNIPSLPSLKSMDILFS